MKKIFSLSFIFALGCILTQSFAADVKYYVSPTGQDNNPGSKEAPFKTFKKAMEQLEENVPAIIYLEENGTFNTLSDDIVIGKNKKVTISGENTTLTSGEKPYLGQRIITIGTNSDVKISGLILKNGCTRDGIPGGALFFEGNKLEIDSCTFSQNEANNSGGAIASCGKDVIITNCVFDQNRIFGGYGGAAVIYHSGVPRKFGTDCSLIIRNTSFTGNISKAYAKGDIVGFNYFYRDDKNNPTRPDYTAGYSNVNYFELVNCLFKDNVTASPSAGDVYIKEVIDGADLEFKMYLVNNTFYNTRAIDFPVNFYGSFSLVNNIFYNKSSSPITSSYDCDLRTLTAHNNVIVGGLDEKIDDPAFTTEKEKYGNKTLASNELEKLKLSPRQLTEGSYAPYLSITDESSILINNGLSSTVGVEGFDKELIPANDIRGIATSGAKDIGSFEYSTGSGIFKTSAKSAEKMFIIKRSGDNTIIQNSTDRPLTLNVTLIDGRTIYSAVLENEITIHKSDLGISNGILILTANDGSRYYSQQTILF